MDAAIVFQYRYLLILAGAGLVLALVAVALVRRLPDEGRRAWAPTLEKSSPTAEGARAVQYALALLVALAVVTAAVLLLPAALVFRFLATWQVAVALVLVVALAAAPVLHLWRSRPF